MYFKRLSIPRTLRTPYRKSRTSRSNTRPVARPKKPWIGRVRYSLIKLKFWERRPSYLGYRHPNTLQTTLLSEIEIHIPSLDAPVELLTTPPPLRKKRNIPLPELDDEEEIKNQEGEQEEEEEECLEAGPSGKRPSLLFEDPEFYESVEPSLLSSPTSGVVIRHSPQNSTWDDKRCDGTPVNNSLCSGTSSSSTGSEETSDHVQSLSSQNDIVDDVNRLPNELIIKICEFLLFSELEPARGNHHLLLGVRGLSRKWRAVGEYVLWLSLRASPDLFDGKELFKWYLEGSKLRALHDTISFAVVEDIHTLDTKYLDLFSAELSVCQRADVKLLVDDLVFKKDRPSNLPLQVSNLRHFFWESNLLGLCEYLPSRLNLPWSNLHSCLPWSSLVNLSLKCPLSMGDAYFVLAEGCNTLEVVSLDAIDFTIARRTADQDTPIPYSRPNSIITLNELKSLSIQSYIDLNDLFTNLHFPKLSSFNLRIVSSTLDSHHPHDQLPGLIADLELPWSQLASLSLDCQDTHRLGEILSKCDSLQNLKWKGRCSDFSTGPPRILHGSPRLADNEETLAALRYPPQPSIVELDSLWARLVNLSLHPDDVQPWPLGLILSKCETLESFEWKGLHSDFSNPGPPTPLRLLKRLVVDYDEEALPSLLQLSTRLLRDLTVPTGSSFSLNRCHFQKTFSVTVKKGMTPNEAARTLLPLQELDIARLDVQIISGEMPDSQVMISSDQLRYLTLRLPSASKRDLGQLLEHISARYLEQLHLSLPEKTFSIPIMGPFLRKSSRSIKVMSCGVPELLPRLELRTIHLAEQL